MELLAVSLALLVLATPVLAIYAVVRQASLRRQLDDLARHTAEQNDALHRELVELRRKVAAFPEAATTATTSPHEEAAKAVTPAAETKPVAPAAPFRPAAGVPPSSSVAPTAPSPATAAPIKPTPAPTPGVRPPVPSDPTQPVFCAWCGTVHAGGVSQCPTAKADSEPAETHRAEPVPASPRDVKVPPRTPAPPSPPVVTQSTEKIAAEGKPETLGVPASPAQVPARVVPSAPPAHSPVVPGSRPPSQPPIPTSVARTEVTHTPPPPPVTPASSASVRGVPAPQFSVLGASAPRPTAQQRMKSVFALEATLVTKWLSRIGITLLVMGFAWLGIHAVELLGPWGKVGLSFIVSFALLGGGTFLEKRERYRIFSYALIGGGWALLFWTSYALNHVQAMRVLESETADLILMLLVAVAMVAHTLRYRSQVVTGLAFLLAYTTVSLSHDTVYSLASGVILAIGLVSIVIKMGWFELEVFGILATFLDHLYWLYRILGPNGAQGQAFPEYHASTALLLFYWLTFRISYIVRKVPNARAEHVSTAAALLNTLLLLGTMKFQSVHPELAFVALLFIGAAEFSFGQLPMIRRRREAFVVLTVVGAALMVAAVPFRYSGNNLAILWLIGGEALLIAGVMFSEVVFRRLGLLTGFLVGWHLATVDFMQLLAVRRTSENLALDAGVMFVLCALVFYLNSLWVGEGWKRYFNMAPDFQLLFGHSYLGAFAAVSAAWALCSEDWTALAFAGIMLVLAALGSKLKSFHLQLQYGLIGALALYRIFVVNLHSEAPVNAHVAMRLFTLPTLAAAFYVTAKWAQLQDDSNQRTLRGVFALVGSALLFALIYYEVPELWQATATIVFAVALVEIGDWVQYHALAWHAHIVAALAVLAALAADPSGIHRWHDMPVHAFGAMPVVAGAYWIAKRIRVPNPSHANVAQIAYSWMGTGVMLWVLNEAVPRPWIAVAWVAFAVALALVMRRIRYRQLAWQANVVAACAVFRVATTNFALDGMLWPGVSLRMATVSLVAAGLYVLSRQAVVSDSTTKRAITYLHTFAATGLLAWLAWYEAPGAWLAAVWAVFALTLALVDQRFELQDLGWQAHALAALAMVRGVSMNLYINETWHGISLRLLSLAIVTAVLYTLSRIARLPQEWRAREFHHIYSWAASALVSLLMWYELQPLSVAVGWAVFGVVLFEYGLLRNTRQFRFQAYVALSASFGRIFFANLAAGDPSRFWGPRIYTVLPLALIFFFVYAQLQGEESGARDDRGLHCDDWLAYIGTGSVVALLYFQYPNEWLVTAWAVVVFALFGVALVLERPIFLYQGILMTVGTCARGIVHNLFGASYFMEGNWTGRYFILGSAVAVLLACLPFAFRLRERNRGLVSRFRWMGTLARHPEQFMFFAAVVLLTLMLAMRMRAGMVTVAWGIEGVMIILLALALNERSFRLTGLILLLACVAKVIILDVWSLSVTDRYITFLILGPALILVSFLYSRYSEKIRQFL